MLARLRQRLLAFSSAFQVQLQPFLAFMVGGGIGLYVVLGIRNPSPAILAASFGCPFTITSFLLGHAGGLPHAVVHVRLHDGGDARARPVRVRRRHGPRTTGGEE
jgi:hypothetical protein